MKQFVPSFFVLFFINSFLFCQIDNVGSGRAIQFDGVNDYIDLGNIYDDLQLPFTVSAWVYLEQSNGYIFPVLVSQDNGALYNGFWFCLSASNLFIEYGDGRGEQNEAYRKGKSAAVSNLKNRWVYVSAVFKSATDIQLYANGNNVGGDYTGSSDQPMASDFAGDVAKIGSFFTNSVVHEFDGVMDELRLWNRSLSEQEIRQTMCQKLKGNEAGLIGYWTFDETEGDVLIDGSSKGFHGQLKGNPTRVFSGAPVGDESVFLYPTSWPGKSLIKDDLSVVNVSGNPFGAHIYKVTTLPSQTGGLNLGTVQPPYYGVFLAADDAPNTFDLTFTGNSVCQFSERTDNSIPTWNQSQLLTGFPERREVILSPEGVVASLEVSLGNDTLLCNKQSLLLEGGIVRPGRTFLWSTGNTSPSITVSSSGAFWVEVRDECAFGRDTIQVLFINTQEVSLVNLGNDTLLCNKFSLLLQGGNVRPGRTFLWSTGSTSPSITVSSSGAFWVEVKEECAVDRDTIQVAFLKTPPAFSLGEDEVFCPFEPRTLITTFSTEEFDITWQDGTTESSFRILDYGIYWLKIENLCGVSADTISFSQKILKDIKHYNFMSPDNEDDLNQYFPIDEQLRGSALAVFNRWGKQVYQSANYQNDWDGNSLPSGIYFYTIRGACFEVQKGTLTISH